MGYPEKKLQITLEQLGLRIDGKEPVDVAWNDVKEIKSRRGRVSVRLRKGKPVNFGIPVEGVAEPTLAGPLTRVVKEASAFYLLGYASSTSPADGKFHRINVRVKGKGFDVRARKGYWALNAEQTARALAPPKPVMPKPMEAALAAISRPSRASVVRTWIGTSRGENGKTRVTFVWEPLPKAPGDRADRAEPTRVSLMALGADGSLVFRGRVPDVAVASTAPAASVAAANASGAAPRGAQRVVFDAPPGKVQLRVSVEGPASTTLDTETREITPCLGCIQTSSDGETRAVSWRRASPPEME